MKPNARAASITFWAAAPADRICSITLPESTALSRPTMTKVLPSGVNAIALTTDTSALTAISNDYGFEWVFARQVEGLAQEGDILGVALVEGIVRMVLVAALDPAVLREVVDADHLVALVEEVLHEVAGDEARRRVRP